MSTNIVILAAGKSTRMNSSIPKVMHLIAERPALGYVIEAAMAIAPEKIILVTSPNMDEIRTFASEQCKNIIHSIQQEALGTADAVKSALPYLDKEGQTIILYGDAPLVSKETLNKITQVSDDLVLVGFYTEFPNEYGRIVTYNDDLLEVVEFKDATEEEKLITFCNSGIYSIKNNYIHNLINLIKNNNAKKEYYLTDIVKIAVQQELKCSTLEVEEEEVLAFNNREELSFINALMQEKIQSKLMNEGVTIINPETSYIAYDFKAGKDVTLYPNVFIGKNVSLGDNVNIRSFSHIEGAKIGDDTNIGPFARIRPYTEISKESRIGNFVEIKNSVVKRNAKINHLSYVGDSEIGSETNIGAGTITCNFDGISTKSRTSIGNKVSIGSNSSLIAPLTIKDGAFIAAGSVVTKNVEEDDLVFARAKQINLRKKAEHLRNKSKHE